MSENPWEQFTVQPDVATDEVYLVCGIDPNCEWSASDEAEPEWFTLGRLRHLASRHAEWHAASDEPIAEPS